MSCSPRETLALTSTLLKLFDVFELFCRHLTDATFINVQAACLVLESGSIEVSSKTSVPHSPATIAGSPRSPGSWLTGSYKSDTNSDSEWEKVCDPLIIFAGLEAIYSACLHLQSHDQALTLVRLYEITVDNLRVIRKVLCDPFVSSTEEESLPGANLIPSYREKATALAISLEAIMV